MSKRYILLLSGCLIGQLAPNVRGYELATHGALTEHAYQNSILNDSQFINDLGVYIASQRISPFGSFYYDISGTNVKQRYDWPFEDDMSKRLGVQPLSLPGWLLRGAIREDDLGKISVFNYGDDPHDDPYGPFWRVMDHFYDPVRNTALTLSSTQATAFTTATSESSTFHKAPDWAMGTSDVFNQPNAPESSRRNHFTVFDAHEAMYRALTGRDKSGNPNIGPGNTPADESVRNAYWATTFRALGDIVHLLQDMAQPQHTRNEPHSGALGYGDKSAYELYIDCRATGGTLGSTPSQSCEPLTYNAYTLPTFNHYSNYFSTAPGGDVTTGRGMADYSNRGFFTLRNNLNPSTILAQGEPHDPVF